MGDPMATLPPARRGRINDVPSDYKGDGVVSAELLSTGSHEHLLTVERQNRQMLLREPWLTTRLRPRRNLREGIPVRIRGYPVPTSTLRSSQSHDEGHL